MIIKKNTLYIVLILAALLVGGFYFIKSSGSTPAVPDNPSDGEVQLVTLSMKNGNYFPNTITVKANQPVRISLDNSVKGCYRSFIVREFSVSKYLATSSDYVEFIPTKQGTFRFACSMGMGTGTLVVE